MDHRWLAAVLTVVGLVTVYPLAASAQPAGPPPEIHCKHFIHGYPLGAPATNDLIIRDLYVLSSNDQRKFADWVCYFLTPHEVDGDLDLERKWRTDPWLAEDETLEATPDNKDDYKGAYAQGYDRGHQAPLASFKGSRFASQVNYYSNITPQRSDMNQGPWKDLEEKVRGLARKHHRVWVMTGPLYEAQVPGLPNCDEPHTVPSGYWKIVVADDDGTLKYAAFIMGQDTPRDTNFADHVVTIRQIENRSGLDFLWELPDFEEQAIELTNGLNWVQQWP